MPLMNSAERGLARDRVGQGFSVTGEFDRTTEAYQTMAAQTALVTLLGHRMIDAATAERASYELTGGPEKETAAMNEEVAKHYRDEALADAASLIDPEAE